MKNLIHVLLAQLSLKDAIDVMKMQQNVNSAYLISTWNITQKNAGFIIANHGWDQVINVLNAYLAGFCNMTLDFVWRNAISQFIKLIRTIQCVEESATLRLNTLIGTTIINAIDVMKVLLLLIIVSDVLRMEIRSIVLNVQSHYSSIKKLTNVNKLVVSSKETTSRVINVIKIISCSMISRHVSLNVLLTMLLMKILEFVVKNVNQINILDIMIKSVWIAQTNLKEQLNAPMMKTMYSWLIHVEVDMYPTTELTAKNVRSHNTMMENPALIVTKFMVNSVMFVIKIPVLNVKA